MKKLITTILFSIIVISVFTSCGNNADDKVVNTSAETTMPITAVETTTKSEETTKEDKLSNLDKVVEGYKTSEDYPADLGEWVSYQCVNATDLSKYRTYMRITKITTYQKDKDYVEKTIAEFNMSSPITKLKNEKLLNGTHYAVADVEYFIPEQSSKVDFCYGAPAPSTMNVMVNGNLSIDSNINNNKTYEVKDNTQKYEIGDNIHTKVIFSITDNLTDYCFKITYPDEFTELYSEAYLGVK